ncbi:hypothetical protein Misp02_34250 [Microtetraspora sp. NBRC 16547]|nr:hypothetical protein Misp02_34250 [Microtetraspora sp. NBRC 16547]
MLEACRARSGLPQTPFIYGVLAVHPALLSRLVGAGLGRMPDALLAPADRELLVLRTLRNCGGEYEWTHHVRQAPGRGLDTDGVRLARDGAHDDGSREALLVLAADDLHSEHTLSAQTWQRLEKHLSHAEILELVVLVGFIRVFALVGNALCLPLEPCMQERVDRPWPVEVKPE